MLVSHFSSDNEGGASREAWPTFLLSSRMEMGLTYFLRSVCLILINITAVVIKQGSVYILQQQHPTSAFCLFHCVCLFVCSDTNSKLKSIIYPNAHERHNTDFNTLLSGLSWTLALLWVLFLNAQMSKWAHIQPVYFLFFLINILFLSVLFLYIPSPKH